MFSIKFCFDKSLFGQLVKTTLILFQNYFFSKIYFWTVKTVLETSFTNLPNPEKPILSFPQPVNLADIFETTNCRGTLILICQFFKIPNGLHQEHNLM